MFSPFHAGAYIHRPTHSNASFAAELQSFLHMEAATCLNSWAGVA
jgi:hypothetical protein